MPFKKGNIPWIKGKKVSQETKTKISNSLKGKREWRFNVSGWNKGIPMTEEKKELLRKSRLGKPSWNKGIPMSESTRKKLSEARKKQGSPWTVGKKFSLSHRKKLSISHKGEKSSLWRGGISSWYILVRSSFEYKEWRKKVYERDNYKCVICNSGGYLQADHIKPFSLFPELCFDINNGRTLCKKCHMISHFGERSTKNIKKILESRGMNLNINLLQQ